MVVYKSNSGQGSGKLIQISPTTLSEITGSKYNSFIIKFSKEYCPPCNVFKEWLDSGKFEPKKDVVIYKVNLDDEKQHEVGHDLRKVFPLRSVPYCVFTNKSLDAKKAKTLSGWNQQEFEQAVMNHFYENK